MSQSLHGGDRYAASKRYGIQEDEILDFSANINPLGLSEQVKEILLSQIPQLIHYPDWEYNALREDLSKYTGVPKDSILPGNGASEVLYLLLDVLQPKNILLPAPCFSEYARAAQACGAEIRYYRLEEEKGFRLSIPQFLSHITGEIDTILLCNPNNPTSALIPKEELLQLIECAKERHVRVILDEAFIELTLRGADNSAVCYLERYSNVCIIRALTKVLAIPGLRLGYGLGDAGVIQKMWERKIPWSVNTFACSMGKALTEDRAYFPATAAWLAAEQEWLYHALSGIPYLKAFRPDSNFILIKILEEEMTSALLKEQLLARGILIRDASNFTFLDHTFVRIAVKDRESNRKIIRHLKEIFRCV